MLSKIVSSAAVLSLVAVLGIGPTVLASDAVSNSGPGSFNLDEELDLEDLEDADELDEADDELEFDFKLETRDEADGEKSETKIEMDMEVEDMAAFMEAMQGGMMMHPTM